MNIFKKKTEKETDESQEKDLKLQILECLNKSLQGTIFDNCLLLPKSGFSIDVQIGKKDIKEDVTLLQVIYILKHDDLDEPIIEPIAAQGKTIDQAVQMAVDSFRGALWHPLNMAITHQGSIPVRTDYLGQSYTFKMYAQSVVLMGDPDKKPAMLINFLKDDICSYLGSKKYYWVRIFLAKNGDKKTIEVRVNGTVCPDLHKRFEAYLDSWQPKEQLVTEKQYAIFVQDEDDQCPFTKEHIVECTRRTIELMEECKSKEEYAELKKEIDEMAGDLALSAEIRIFVPEIMARHILRYNEGDSLFLMQLTEDNEDAENNENSENNENNDESEEKKPKVNMIEFKKTQLRSYFYIQQVIFDHLARVKPDKEKVMRIVANSAAFREIQKHVKEGHQPTEMWVPGTTYQIAVENYKVW